MKTRQVQQLYQQYILPTYTQIPLCLVKGKGARVWDLEGREYLDFFPGWAVSGLGHCHPAVVNAIKTQSRKILHISNNFLNLKQARLAEMISKKAFPARVFFCNSGAEAAEAGIKFARRYGHAAGRYEMITMKKSFHGRTLGAMTATGQERIRSGVGPLPEGFRYAELNDLESVRRQVTEKTIAVFLEPVLGEGGVQVATADFMRGLRKLCDENNMLLMLDEVQTGMGRTGKMFAYQHSDIEPDLMTLAKSLGGGVPIGALVVHEKLGSAVLTPGTHGSTYGGNPLAASAALAVFDAIRKEGLLKNAQVMGQLLAEGLEELKSRHAVIEEIRGLGLMRGVALKIPGGPVVDKARAKGLLINCTQETVLRIMPPINVTRKQIVQALKILEEVLCGIQEDAAVRV